MPPFANLFRLRKRFSHHSPKEGITKMKKSVSEPSPTYVTREELDALVRVIGLALAGVELAHNRASYADGTIATQLERIECEDAAERAALKKIAKAFDARIEANRAAEHRRMRERGSAYQQM
jgi:hypothetical protein